MNMNGLTHNNYLGDKRHTRPMTEGILYYSNMDARQAEEQIQQFQQRQQQKSTRSSRWRRSSHTNDDNASIFSQLSTISLIKSKFHRSRHSKETSREDEMKRMMQAQ